MKDGELSEGDIIDTHLEQSDRPSERFPIGRNPRTRKVILLDDATPLTYKCKVGDNIRVKIVRRTQNFLIGMPIRILTQEEVGNVYHAPPIANTEWEILACPLCGASQELLTCFFYNDKLLKQVVADGYCNNCKRGWLVIPVMED